MKKLISLILVICMCVSLMTCFASCDTENEQAENTTTNNKSDNNEENTTEKPTTEENTTEKPTTEENTTEEATTEENTTEEATTEENTTEANRKLTEEEWYALADPELYTNFTVIATQIDKFFKTVSETRLVDEYLYVSYTLYDPNTGESSYSHKGSNSLDAAIMATLLPDMKDYSKMEYDAVNDIYRYSEPFEVIDRSNPDNPITITYTTYEWTIKDGRIHKIYCEFWYIDSQEGRIDATQTSEYINYGTTVAP